MGSVFLLPRVLAPLSALVCSQQGPPTGRGPNAGGFVLEPPVHRRPGNTPRKDPTSRFCPRIISLCPEAGAPWQIRLGWWGTDKPRTACTVTSQPRLPCVGGHFGGRPEPHRMSSTTHPPPIRCQCPPICNQDPPDVARCPGERGRGTPRENHCYLMSAPRILVE